MHMTCGRFLSRVTHGMHLQFIRLNPAGSSVGKTSFMRSFCGGAYTTDYPSTIGLDFGVPAHATSALPLTPLKVQPPYHIGAHRGTTLGPI